MNDDRGQTGLSPIVPSGTAALVGALYFKIGLAIAQAGRDTAAGLASKRKCGKISAADAASASCPPSRCRYHNSNMPTIEGEIMKKVLACALILFAVALGGCASVPMGDPQADAALKTFAPKPGKASLYVYRHETFGAAIKMTVLLDGKLLGDTASKTYLYAEVDPGKHQLISKTENDAVLDIDVLAGNNYYVWQEVKMGMFAARSFLQKVDDKAGQEGVLQCKLAAPSAK